VFYGQAVSATDDEGNDIEYTGRENDETGLYYYRARYYDPVLNRFVSEDPIGLLGGFNVYTYAYDPITQIDPYGLAGKSKKPSGPKRPRSSTAPSKDGDIESYLENLSNVESVDPFADFICLEALCSYDDPCTGRRTYRVVNAWLPNRPYVPELPENCVCQKMALPFNYDPTGARNPFRAY
jgi:RHS repeat-associated protein